MVVKVEGIECCALLDAGSSSCYAFGMCSENDNQRLSLKDRETPPPPPPLLKRVEMGDTDMKPYTRSCGLCKYKN